MGMLKVLNITVLRKIGHNKGFLWPIFFSITTGNPFSGIFYTVSETPMLTQFTLIPPFHTPWKRPKTKGFLTFREYRNGTLVQNGLIFNRVGEPKYSVTWLMNKSYDHNELHKKISNK